MLRQAVTSRHPWAPAELPCQQAAGKRQSCWQHCSTQQQARRARTAMVLCRPSASSSSSRDILLPDMMSVTLPLESLSSPSWGVPGVAAPASSACAMDAAWCAYGVLQRTDANRAAAFYGGQMPTGDALRLQHCSTAACAQEHAVN